MKLTIEIEVIQSDVHGCVKTIMEHVLKAYSYSTFKVLSWKISNQYSSRDA